MSKLSCQSQKVALLSEKSISVRQKSSGLTELVSRIASSVSIIVWPLTPDINLTFCYTRHTLTRSFLSSTETIQRFCLFGSSRYVLIIGAADPGMILQTRNRKSEEKNVL